MENNNCEQENKAETMIDIKSSSGQATEKKKSKSKTWLWILIPAIIAVLAFIAVVVIIVVIIIAVVLAGLFVPGMANKQTLDKSYSVQEATPSYEEVIETPQVTREFSDILTDGAWYEYGYQDTYADEWVFYDDGTCTSMMRVPQEALENSMYDDSYTYVDNSTYSVEGNKVTIYGEYEYSDDDVYTWETVWEYDENENCCWYYFDDGFGICKLKIFHHDERLTQAELDESFEQSVDDYLFVIDNTNIAD